MEETETAESEQPLETSVGEETVVEGQAVVKGDELEHKFNFSYEEFAARQAYRLENQPISPIRSTTRNETPLSACTRRTDEISTNGFSSSNWPETNFRRRRATAAAAHDGRWLVSEEGAAKARDTASRGPTIIVAPESQFRTCPMDHDSIGYPRMSASGESSTTMHRLLHASGSHPIPTPYDPNTTKTSDLSTRQMGLIHSTNGNHLESPKKGSSIDHQVTIYLHAQNITMFPTNETWIDASTDSFVTEPVAGMELADVIPTVEEKTSADEAMTLEEILLKIPDGFSLPSTTGEVTKIQLGKSISIPGVDEGDSYKASIPKIPAADKGKAPLLERDPIKAIPSKEIFYLIIANINFLVQLRETVIHEVDRFFNSFSFKKLANLKIEEIYAKEELVLSWAEADSTRVAFHRRMYILTKYRELLIRKFLEVRKSNFVPSDGSSATDLKVLDWLPDLHLFVLEELKEQPVSEFGFRRSTVTSLGWSQLCAAFLRYSLFGGFSTVDIHNFVSAISLDRSVFREPTNLDSVVQRAPLLLLTDSGTQEDLIVHMVINQRPDSPSTSANSSMRFDEDDTTATQFSLPAISTDLTEAFAQLHASDRAYRALLNNICKDIHDQKILMSLDVLTSQQKLSTQVTAIALDNADIRKEVKEQRSILTDLDGQVATVRSELLDFCVKAEENHLNLSTQLGFLVDYINRGGDAKKGECGSSSQPQPPPDDQSVSYRIKDFDQIRVLEQLGYRVSLFSLSGHVYTVESALE
ncbi:hypothetical protein F511_25422 [Dorcoceras hygrometricum]|uniref:Uncharacterized protein n=1 Tax=Dorcoceras hygrometricum TaxID=472368 RepID=A0A2Z7AFE4_9LAMI|nr:hypothetical protein F511_25422 [Dorcoceras hygrometricum]